MEELIEMVIYDRVECRWDHHFVVVDYLMVLLLMIEVVGNS